MKKDSFGQIQIRPKLKVLQVSFKRLHVGGEMGGGLSHHLRTCLEATGEGGGAAPQPQVEVL